MPIGYECEIIYYARLCYVGGNCVISPRHTWQQSSRLPREGRAKSWCPIITHYNRPHTTQSQAWQDCHGAARPVFTSTVPYRPHLRERARYATVLLQASPERSSVCCMRTNFNIAYVNCIWCILILIRIDRKKLLSRQKTRAIVQYRLHLI